MVEETVSQIRGIGIKKGNVGRIIVGKGAIVELAVVAFFC